MNYDDCLPHMRDVVSCEASLRDISLMWRLIEATARMSCPDGTQGLLSMLAATREGFEALERDLIASFARQKVANLMVEVGTPARHAIDALVRNLYERTADVGFLATDRALREFLAGEGMDRAQATERLRAYREKYTVYDTIALLGPDGHVQAAAGCAEGLKRCEDTFVARTLATDGYVETFGPTALEPGGASALVYSQRMLHPLSGQPVGVLCLVFGFSTEMAGIFASRHTRNGRANLVVLDGDDRIIASAEPAWMPVGVQVPTNTGEEVALRTWAGRKYLVQTFLAQGFQGYPGPPGWKTQTMVPLDLAFSTARAGVVDTLEEPVVDGLLGHSASFCPPLHDIIVAADAVRRVVWNGQVMAPTQHRDERALRTVLEQITSNGSRSDALFTRSIHELCDTALASRLSDARFTAQWLVELLDRNLYERANDCRWWALAPELGACLAAPDSRQLADEASRVLKHINSLYTVYTRLVVYDRGGRIVAASHAMDGHGSSVVGTRIEGDTLEAVLGLRDGQQYHVTPLRPSALYGGRPTWVYHAAIRDPGDVRVLGGIGIVFDTAPQLEAMLHGALAGRADELAAFIDREGRIVCANDPRLAALGRLEGLPPEMLQLGRGQGGARIVVRDGQYMVLGVAASPGYREFKLCDGYGDEVLAVTLQPLGPVQEGRAAARRRTQLVPPTAGRGEPGMEYATFCLGDEMFAVRADQVVEAQPASQVHRLPSAGRTHRVGMLALRRDGVVLRHVSVFDLDALLGGPGTDLAAGGQVVVLRSEQFELGLLVSDLHGVWTFPASQAQQAPWSGDAHPPLVTQLLTADEGRQLIQVLDVQRLRDWLSGRPLLRRPDAEPAPRLMAVG
ncbi:chemotaxis protein CheW [Azohydromonas caseinilytica]|uniref:Chemotaxis protein CheW n=1 Tax=Azohydromonas caseinilytica TaxID=2728836 RepID=A0A848FE60_9BURK|nr:chemotaxis protein CheW [Azohydromonas caseinilytica]NML18497.1 chemotaxis protein CheW [Azohydromonas caseinilytica]